MTCSPQGYLARIAACNFNASIYDTNSLSVIRGSSLALLNFPDKFMEELKHPPLTVTLISAGASELLIEIKDDGVLDTAALENTFHKILSTDTEEVPFSLFSFLVAIEDSQDRTLYFNQRLDLLKARCNAQQYQIPTYTPGDHTIEPIAKRPCALDHHRPAVVELNGDMVSYSVQKRWALGRKARTDFYEKQLGKESVDKLIKQHMFAQSFVELVEAPPHNVPEALQSKIALIYLDGNSFGKHRDTEDLTPERLQEFSKVVTSKRKTLLIDVLKALAPTSEGETTFPLETLLWGGDEVLWVLPAWKAWETIGAIQANLNREDWAYNGRLTHAMGVVIAPHKAPIRELRALADSLGSAAKSNRDQNGLQIALLTGVDLPGVTAEDVRRPLIQAATDSFPHELFQIDGKDWPALTERMKAITAPNTGLPRSKIYDLYHQALEQDLFRAENKDDAQRFLDQGIERLETVLNGALDSQLIDALKGNLPGLSPHEDYPLMALFHILQLWNLVPGETNS